MIAITGLILGLTLGGVLAEPPGSFTTGAVIRFPSDDNPQQSQQPSFNNVQGLRYFATGPYSAQPLSSLYGGGGASSPDVAQIYSGRPKTGPSFNIQPGRDNLQAAASSYDVQETQNDYKVAYNPAPQNNFQTPTFANQNQNQHQFQTNQDQFQANQQFQMSAYPPKYPPQPFPPQQFPPSKEYKQNPQIPFNHQPAYKPIYSPNAQLATNHKQTFQNYLKHSSPLPLKAYTYGPPKEHSIAYRPRKPAFAMRPNAPKYHNHKGNAYPIAAGSSPAIYGTPHRNVNLRPQGYGMFRPEVYNTITEQMLGGMNNHRSSVVEPSKLRLPENTDALPHEHFIIKKDGGQKTATPVVGYKGLRPAVSVYHKSQNQASLASPASMNHVGPSHQYVVPVDLVGGRSAGGSTGSSSWVPINAPDGAVPARAYHIAPPDLSRGENAFDNLRLHEASSSTHDFPEALRLRIPEMSERRVGESGNSEEVVSAVVLVKQKK